MICLNNDNDNNNNDNNNNNNDNNNNNNNMNKNKNKKKNNIINYNIGRRKLLLTFQRTMFPSSTNHANQLTGVYMDETLVVKRLRPSANFKKWSNTLKQFVDQLPTNCLSVFDYFVGLAPKGLIECIDVFCWE